MKYVITGVVLLFLTYLSWPYFYVYRIDRALAGGDRVTLAKLVDLHAVRNELRRSMEQGVTNTLGKEPGNVLGWIKDQVSGLGGQAIDELVDLQWVQATLKEAYPTETFRAGIDHAFFESWDEFVIRLGELGDNPVHVRLSLTNGNWRITGIYE